MDNADTGYIHGGRFSARSFSFAILLLSVPFSILTPQSRSEEIPFPCLGKVRPRHAKEIVANNWSIGAETMDRDYTIYKNWKEYLGPLGFKHARIQSGWMKCEPRPGKYDFAWLDEIVFDMHEQGVKPWMNLSWGNKHYTQWTSNNRGKAPTTREALLAWEQFVRLLVKRYGHVIDEWEIWNEVTMAPGGQKSMTPSQYADLARATLDAVLPEQPDATIMIFALDSGFFESMGQKDNAKFKFITAMMDTLKDRDLIRHVDMITYHPYAHNPDDVYEKVDILRRFAKSHGAHLRIFQGENGVPSERNEHRALADYDWTETAQAKWALRRMLGDLGRDVRSSYFGIMDMSYQEEINRKGLLHANPDKTVHHRKKAYFALQAMAAIFDASLERIRDLDAKTSSKDSLSIFGYRHKETDAPLISFWMDGEIPSHESKTQRIDITVKGVAFRHPVYVDLLTGKVHDILDSQWTRKDEVVRFKDVPCSDSPALIAERSLIPLQ